MTGKGRVTCVLDREAPLTPALSPLWVEREDCGHDFMSLSLRERAGPGAGALGG